MILLFYLNNPNIYHLVKEGDTLFSISVKYNILMKKLLEWNALEENVHLSPNNKILLVEVDNDITREFTSE